MKHQLAALMLLALTTHGHVRSSDGRGKEPRWVDLGSDFDKPTSHRSERPGGGDRAYPSSSRITRLTQ
jgi:hypothetical protein